MPFRPVGISGFYSVAALATEYFAFGPIRIDTEISALIAHVNMSSAGSSLFAPVLCDSAQANAANHATGIPLIEQSESRLNGQPAALVAVGANGMSVLTITTSRKIRDTNKWVVIGHTNTGGGAGANVLASIAGFLPVSDAEAGSTTPPGTPTTLISGFAAPGGVAATSAV